MDTHSVVAVSPATNVVEDNHEILIIELPCIVRKDCGRCCYAVLEDCKCAEKERKGEKTHLSPQIVEPLRA